MPTKLKAMVHEPWSETVFNMIENVSYTTLGVIASSIANGILQCGSP